ncbi:MAG: hypothetical protein GXW99_09145 [Clostridiales bacterium]|nr:hypothetical protein [Clostridiales bacterium]
MHTKNWLFIIFNGLFCFVACLGGLALNHLVQGQQLVQNLWVILASFLVSGVVFCGIALLIYRALKKDNRWRSI